VQSENPDASWLIVRDANDVATKPDDINDIGSTADFFAVLSGQPDCSSSLFRLGSFYGWSGFPITLYGSSGQTGSCCDTNAGVCTDGVVQGNCDNVLSQSWNALPCNQRTGCVPCAVADCPIGSPNNLENEPDCGTNYVDSRNRGCQNLTA